MFRTYICDGHVHVRNGWCVSSTATGPGHFDLDKSTTHSQLKRWRRFFLPLGPQGSSREEQTRVPNFRFRSSSDLWECGAAAVLLSAPSPRHPLRFSLQGLFSGCQAVLSQQRGGGVNSGSCMSRRSPRQLSPFPAARRRASSAWDTVRNTPYYRAEECLSGCAWLNGSLRAEVAPHPHCPRASTGGAPAEDGQDQDPQNRARLSFIHSSPSSSDLLDPNHSLRYLSCAVASQNRFRPSIVPASCMHGPTCWFQVFQLDARWSTATARSLQPLSRGCHIQSHPAGKGLVLCRKSQTPKHPHPPNRYGCAVRDSFAPKSAHLITSDATVFLWLAPRRFGSGC